MSADIYILGTSHSIQSGSDDLPANHTESFTAEVTTLLEKHGIKRVAEEMSDDGLERLQVTGTLAQRLAAELKLEYHAIDLSRKERENLSLVESTVLQAMGSFDISNGSNLMEVFNDLVYEVRERVWVARILANKGWPVLFICGANHSIAVEKLSRSVGLTAHTVHVDYKP